MDDQAAQIRIVMESSKGFRFGPVGKEPYLFCQSGWGKAYSAAFFEEHFPEKEKVPGTQGLVIGYQADGVFRSGRERITDNQ